MKQKFFKSAKKYVLSVNCFAIYIYIYNVLNLFMLA